MFKVELQTTKAFSSLDQVTELIVQRLMAKSRLLANDLQKHIVADKLQGQVLKHRTGALGRSIQVNTTRDGNKVTSEVYSSGDVKYAAIHEFGFHGSETVRQHLRTVVFGKTVAPFSVGPFTREMNMPERSFMRSSLEDMAAQIVAGLRQTAISAANEAMQSKG